MTERDVIAINRDVILRYTPNEDILVKDYNLLSSAVNRPRQSAFGDDAYKTVFEKGAALLESIAKNHAFESANKRTAFTSLVVFLHINGYLLQMDQKYAEDFVVDVTTHKYTFEQVVMIISKHCILKR